MDDRGGRRADRGALGVDRDRPHHRPVRPQPLLDRAVGQEGAARGPPVVAVRQRRVSAGVPVAPVPVAPASLAVSSMTTYGSSSRRRRTRVVSGVSTTISVSPGRASSRASSTPASRRSARSWAAASRRGRTTTVSYPSGGVPSAGNGSRSRGTWPSRRISSSPRPGLWRATSRAASRAWARSQRTPPVRLSTAGSSLTARTAAKPTPKRPMLGRPLGRPRWPGAWRTP
ncbi:hypothetical protein ACFQVA_24290 [Actinomadura keratinilytica]